LEAPKGNQIHGLSNSCAALENQVLLEKANGAGEMGIPFGYPLLVYLARPNMEKIQEGNPKK
jgi:hypothetical protein